jgi:hypothetical protein
VSEIVGQRDEAVYQAIEEGIQRVNTNAVARPYHTQKWAILERDFSISGGELGRFFLSLFLGGTWEGRGRGNGSGREEPIRRQLWPAEGLGQGFGWHPSPSCGGHQLLERGFSCVKPAECKSVLHIHEFYIMDSTT